MTSYGFLRVPGTADLRLSLRAGLDPLQVREDESVDFDVADGIVLPEGEQLVLNADRTASGGARPEAACRVVSGTVIRYSAGGGAPWTDSCIVAARLSGQEQDTFLTLPVEVEAETPQPTLRSASLGVRPGETQSYDLARMVQWAGPEDWEALEFSTDYAGDQFEVTAARETLTVTARDDARPGREERTTVSLPSHPDAPAATIVLTVGPSPSTLPRGGSAVQACSQSDGNSSCTIEVIGADGEVNPLPGTPLRVVAAASAGNCPGVSFAPAGERAVRASWSSDAEGAARCAGSFVVEDAQGRQSSGDRNGQVVLDLRGLPANPTRLEWTAFAEDSVTLRVTSDAGSYPDVRGYRITTGGREVATCPASGACAPIAAPVGEQRTYEAQALNDVGTSRGSVRTTAWAYRPPAQPSGSRFDPVPNGNEGGVATIVVTGLDDTTGSVRLSGGAAGSDTQPVSGGTATFSGYRVGSNDPTPLTAIPLTEFDLPPIAGGSTEGRSLEVSAHGIGAPAVTLDVRQNDDGSTVTATATVTPNGVGEAILVGFSTGGEACVPGAQRTGGRGGTVTKTFNNSNLPLWERTTVRACAQTVDDGERFGDGAPVAQEFTPVGPIDAPGGDDTTYEIGTRAERFAEDGMSVYRWADITPPRLRGTLFFEVRYSSDGGTTYTRDFRSLFSLGSPPGRIIAALCNDSFGCGTASAREITAGDGPDYPVQVRFPDSCDVGEAPRGEVQVTANGDHSVPPVRTEDKALRRDYVYSVEWSGRLADLGTTSHTKTCVLPPPEPEPEPDPEPEPEPTPTPTTPPPGS